MIEGFGARLRTARKAKKLTIHGLLQMAYSSPTSICNWENETRMPNAESLLYLCKALDVSADWLLGLTDKKKSAQSAGTLKGADE